MSQVQKLNLVSVENGLVYFTVGNGETATNRKLKQNATFSKQKHIYQVVGNKIVCLGDKNSVVYDESEQDTVTTVEKLSVDSVSVVKKPFISGKSPFQPLQSEFTINERFSFFEKFTNMVLDGITASAIVTGEGGLGKSHTVMTELQNRNWIEEIDYIIVKGYATPKALYATLYEHNGKTIIFDDCDSVLKDPTAINLLKGALDSYDKRTISWLQKGFNDDGLPPSFEFTGHVIFISNMSSDKLDQAIKSRSIVIDLSMSLEDKIERMQFILSSLLPEYPIEIKQIALDFITKHANEAKEFNLRTLQKTIKVINAYGVDNNEWESAAKYLLVHN